MKKITIGLLTCFIILSNILKLSGQETQSFKDPEHKLNTAIELYQKKDFKAAKDLLTELKHELNEENNLLKTTAEYYNVLCSIELHQPQLKSQIEDFIQNNPAFSQTPLIYYQLGKLEFRNRNYDGALKALKKVNPNDLNATEKEDLNFRLGFIYVKKDEPQKAKKFFENINDESNSKYSKAASYYKAHINYQEGNYSAALPTFEKLRKDRTYKRAVPFYIIQIYYKEGQHDKIIEMGPSLLKDAKSSRKAEIARLIGDAYYRSGDFEKAAEYFDVYERSNRQELDRDDYYQLGFVHFKEGKYKRAINNFEKVITDPDSLSQNAQYHLAQSYFENGQKQFAANAFLAAYKMDLDQDISQESLFKYIELSRNLPNNPYNESISLLETFINNHPDSKNSERAYSLLIDLFYSTKNYKAALEAIDNLNLNNPKIKEAYQQIAFHRGVELFNQKKYAEAIETFTKARKHNINPEIDAKAIFWTAESFYQEKNYWGAQKYYLQFLSYAPAKQLDIYNLANYNLAYTYYKRESYPQAIESFLSFVNYPGKVNSNLESDAFIRMGDCYFVSRRSQDALHAYDQAIHTNTGDLDYAWYQKAQTYGAMGNLNAKEDALRTIVRK